MWQNLKLKMWQNIKNSKCDKTKWLQCDKTQKVKIWQNYKNSICDKTYKLKMGQNSKTPNVAKIKMWQEKEKIKIATKLITLNCSKTHILELWRKSQNSNTQILTTKKIKMWQNSTTRIKTKF